jgi:Ca2+-binding RTX toxin-like protein
MATPGWTLRFVTAALAFCSAGFISVAPAGAATVQLAPTHARISSYDGLVLSVDAAPGERNEIVVRVRDGRTEVLDLASSLSPGSGCRSDAGGAVSCDPERVDVWVVDLGDGDDTLTVQAPFFNAWYFGGEGNDRITGSSGGSEFFAGGAGADELRGGAGTDVFDEDGPRHSPEADLYDGGAGEDMILYTAPTRDRGITVNLTEGTGPEGDQLVAIESINATDHDDVLIGSEQGGTIYARGGDDWVDARGGDDKVWTDWGVPGWSTATTSSSDAAEMTR